MCSSLDFSQCPTPLVPVRQDALGVAAAAIAAIALLHQPPEHVEELALALDLVLLRLLEATSARFALSFSMSRSAFFFFFFSHSPPPSLCGASAQSRRRASRGPCRRVAAGAALRLVERRPLAQIRAHEVARAVELGAVGQAVERQLRATAGSTPTSAPGTCGGARGGSGVGAWRGAAGATRRAAGDGSRRALEPARVAELREPEPCIGKTACSASCACSISLKRSACQVHSTSTRPTMHPWPCAIVCGSENMLAIASSLYRRRSSATAAEVRGEPYGSSLCETCSASVPIIERRIGFCRASSDLTLYSISDAKGWRNDSAGTVADGPSIGGCGGSHRPVLGEVVLALPRGVGRRLEDGGGGSAALGDGSDDSSRASAATDSGESEDAPSEAAAAPDHIGRAVFAGGG